MKRIMFIVMLLILITSVNSVNYLRYDFKDESNNNVNSINAIGFICNTNQCSITNGDPVIGNLWNGNTKSSATNSIILDLPTSSEAPSNSRSFYVLFLNSNYKTRAQLIPVIAQLTGMGSTQSNPYYNTNSIITLLRVAQCSSPVSVSVVNNIRENLPVSVTSGANLDATTKAAFGLEDPSWYSKLPPAAKPYFEVETTLHLRIYRYNATTSKNIGTPIHEEDVVERIYYDDTANVEFNDWMPPEQIDQFSYYNVSVESDVTDPKCSSKINQRASKILRVWRDDPRNECYSLIDTEGLVFSPVDFSNRRPEAGEEVTISLRKLSNYANDFEPWEPQFALTPQDTNMNIRLKRIISGMRYPPFLRRKHVAGARISSGFHGRSSQNG